ncbi:MAG: class I SAM-dependent methyltransferase [Deltaproteobacteria bacterium]|nr:class I SAM-dependent methyltransferase [Deltaproteobacteria bacterium]
MSDILQAMMARARDPLRVEREMLIHVIEKIIELGYLKSVVEFVANNLSLDNSRLLDVGCGACWFAPFFLARGVSQYHGIDEYLDLTTQTIFDRRKWLSQRKTSCGDLPMSLGDFLSCFPDIQTTRTQICNFNPDGIKFDRVIMLTVSEHLDRPQEALAHVAGLLSPNGRIFLTHHNYYAWTGHHYPPQTVQQYDPVDPTMTELADWNHVFNVALVDKKMEQINCIRIHELMDILSSHFDIETVAKVSLAPETGLNRMTPEIRKKLAAYYDEELFTEMVHCCAVKKNGQPASSVRMREAIPIHVNNMRKDQGNCFTAFIPWRISPSEFVLLEDGQELGPGQTTNIDIRIKGEGRYLIWSKLLYFSASDNSDPMVNGRLYTLRAFDHTLN